MKNIAPILKSLGLLESEISTYMAALEQGPSTVIDLAKKSQLSRQATYTAIDMLSERGLMSNVLRGKKRFYAAEPPTKLLSYAKRKDTELHDKVKDLENILPELELQAGGEKPVVKVFEGKEGLKGIIEDMKVSREKESYEITDLDAMYGVLSPEDLQEMRDSMRDIGRHIKGIYSGSARKTEVDVARCFLPDSKKGFGSNISIYGNKIVMATFGGKMHSLVIESESLTEAMRIIFEYAFKNLKQRKG